MYLLNECKKYKINVEGIKNRYLHVTTIRSPKCETIFQTAICEDRAAETRAQLANIGQAAVSEPNAMEQCLAALNVVEGSATPPPPPTPPMTTERISYDDTLRVTRQR